MEEVDPLAALGLAGIAGEFDAIDGEHAAADQALPVAEPEDLGEEFGGFIPQA